jgi:hypothetical protein
LIGSDACDTVATQVSVVSITFMLDARERLNAMRWTSSGTGANIQIRERRESTKYIKRHGKQLVARHISKRQR